MPEDFASGDYWARREDSLYYRYVDYIVRTVGREAKTLLDVGTGNCPYLEWFYWIDRKVSIDMRVPYRSKTVEGMVGDIHEMDFGEGFDIVTCLQVLEHVPDASIFGRRLLELGKIVVVSVPYRWDTSPRTLGHIHDPVTYKKLTAWMGREANYREVVREPFHTRKSERLIAIYDVQAPSRKISSNDIKARRARMPC